MQSSAIYYWASITFKAGTGCCLNMMGKTKMYKRKERERFLDNYNTNYELKDAKSKESKVPLDQVFEVSWSWNKKKKGNVDTSLNILNWKNWT